MMLAQSGMEQALKLQVAIAVYAIMRTVHTARTSNQKLNAAALIRLYMA